MKRPENWDQLPYYLKEDLLESMDHLEYDPYESSRQDAIHELLCDGTACSRNYRLAQVRYKAMSDDELVLRANGVREMLLRAAADITRMLDESTV